MHHLFHELEDLLQALDGIPIRAVGGAVRAVLRHDPLQDVEIDLATPASPETILQACLAAKILTTTPGLRWGTVTAHLGPKTYEITTLRQDAYTPGSRYPTVTFTDDWQADAQRRDFTINAIYLDPAGELFDPTGGEADLKNGLVRFIGDPAQRLREDPLRLLRFWRFCANYGMGGLTPEVAEALVQAIPAIASLSRNRVAAEWAKLQQAPQAATVIAEMQRLHILPAILSRISSLATPLA